MGALKKTGSGKRGWKEIPIGGIIEEQKTSLKNKTGSWRSFRPVFHSERCIHCMNCVYYCPENAIPVQKQNNAKPIRLDTNLDYCKGCGLCASVCPVSAIEMKEESSFLEDAKPNLEK